MASRSPTVIHTLFDEPKQVQRSDRDKPLAGNTENQPNAQFDDGDAKRNDEGITKPPTRNINYSFDDQGKLIGRPENAQRSDGDKPLAGNADAKRNDEGNTEPPTGNFNKGPGAGAINRGTNAGSIIRHEDVINFKPSKDDSEVSVPSDGNINRGPGAGAVNSGEGSASIVDCKGAINF